METFWIIWNALGVAKKEGELSHVIAGIGHIKVIENDGTERKVVVS